MQTQPFAPKTHGGPPAAEIPDIKEYGAPKDGVRQSSERRLFFQLLVYTECRDAHALIKLLEASALEAVLYLDMNDPRGVGLLFMSENPDLFTVEIRKLLTSEPFISLKPRPELTMVGRTYSSGFEQDLEDWLLRKPRRNARNPDLPWVVWYPLRRRPEFELLTKDEQRPILMEHARLGMGYGAAGFAHDIRLACHGLDRNDNEFLLGIVSKELYLISRLVQDMRKTQQTSKYIQSLGPFFVGKVLYAKPY